MNIHWKWGAGGNIHARRDLVGEQNSNTLTRYSCMTTKFIRLRSRGNVNPVGKNKAVQMEGLLVLPSKRRWDENWDDRQSHVHRWTELKRGGNRQNKAWDGCQQPQRLRGTTREAPEGNTLSLHARLWNNGIRDASGARLLFSSILCGYSRSQVVSKQLHRLAQQYYWDLSTLVERRVHQGGCSKRKHFLSRLYTHSHLLSSPASRYADFNPFWH